MTVKLKCDIENFELDDSGRDLCLHHITNRMSHKRLTDRCLHSKLTCHEISFLLAYKRKVHDLVSVKVLNEIVFLFWQCSGYYVEETVLPGDVAVYESFVIYEKYREALTNDHRKQVYKCLMRYSRANSPIPKDVFERLERLYPDECIPAKAVALDVLLHLIHTDIMRRELFEFIKKNYDGEEDGVKAVINRNLCRVFYGGFLQGELLEFFDAHFDKEPEQTRTVILDKLMLSVRIVAVQRRIIAFIDKHYDSFNSEQKIKFYSTFLEMLPPRFEVQYF